SERTTHEGPVPCNFSVQGEVGTQWQADSDEHDGRRAGDTHARLACRGASQGESWCMTVWEDTIALPLRALHLDTTRNQILAFAGAAAVIPTLATTRGSYPQDPRWRAPRA